VDPADGLDGERGPLRVDAMAVRVRTKEERRVGPEERLVVTRHVEATPRIHYSLSNAGRKVRCPSWSGAVHAHRIEEVFGRPRARSGWGSTRCGAGWAGTTT
jgi:hypothetical protein